MTEQKTQKLKIGATMEDGTVYVGMSPDTNKPLFAMPVDASLTTVFGAAAAYANQLNIEKAYGHDDWRLPTKAELMLLFLNKEKGALKGTFNLTALYKSSTPDRYENLWCQRFSDGDQNHYYSTIKSSIRCIRG